MTDLPTFYALANCATLPLADSDRLFFGTSSPVDRAEAMALCASCPVKRDCQDRADVLEADCTSRGFMAGIWGGETVPARVERRKEAARAQRAAS